MDDVATRYYLRLQVKDKPGVIAAIATILGKEKISISSFVQKERQNENNVSLLILTHLANEKMIKRAIMKIEKLDEVCDKIKLLRIEDI
jgi:homoserine dehydrogenase